MRPQFAGEGSIEAVTGNASVLYLETQNIDWYGLNPLVAKLFDFYGDPQLQDSKNSAYLFNQTEDICSS